jgi:hypothetical protein
MEYYMTMPHERTRAMRWMWEFLWELQTADNLTLEEREKLGALLLHHPSGSEIKQWALQRRSLEPEEKIAYPQECNVPDFCERGVITPQQRAKAMHEAFFWLRASNVQWTEKQRREKMYVLRHYPGFEHGELSHVISSEQRAAHKHPGHTPWVLPFDEK